MTITGKNIKREHYKEKYHKFLSMDMYTETDKDVTMKCQKELKISFCKVLHMP